MEWYWGLLISLGGLVAVAVVSLHAFEHFYRKKLDKDSQMGISNFSFNIESTTNLTEDHASRSPVYARNAQGSYASTTASPASMTFSDFSSPSSSSMEFSRSSASHLPQKPKTVHVKPPKVFISFEHLRRTSNEEEEEEDLEAQGKAVGGTMKGLGW